MTKQGQDQIPAKWSRLADMGETWRLGSKVPLNVYGEPTAEWPEGRPVCQCHTTEDAARIVAAVNAQTPPAPPMYPGTRFLTLCTLDGRRGGGVTVGESRLPVAGVLATIRAVGLAEAACMWPQLTEEELAVLKRLVTDIDERAREDDEDDEVEPTAVDPHRIELCWTPQQNNARVSVYPSRSPVIAVVSQLHAGEPPEDVAVDYDVTVDGVRLLSRLAAELTEEIDDLTYDGDVLREAILNATPRWMSDHAAAELAEAVLAALAALPGVTVVRGPDSEPWTPGGPAARDQGRSRIPASPTTWASGGTWPRDPRRREPRMADATVPELPKWARRVLADATTELDRLRHQHHAHGVERQEIERILAEALGYPLGEEGGPQSGDPVIGDHTPVTLAMEAARDVTGLRLELDAACAALIKQRERADRAESEADRLRAELAVPCADGTRLLPHYDEQGHVRYLRGPSA